MTPTDLRISLSYLTVPMACKRGIPTVEAQAGFYVSATSNDGYVEHVKLIRIEHYPDVESIARAIDRATGATPGTYPVLRAVQNVRTQHQRDAIARRRAAEAQLAAAQATLAALDRDEPPASAP